MTRVLTRAAVAAMMLHTLCVRDAARGVAQGGDRAAPTYDPRVAVRGVARNHPYMHALVTNAFQYVAPGQGTIDAASGYPCEGWNHDPQRGVYLRSFTQLTAIGAWINLLANIAAGRAENPYISPKQALDRLQFVLGSLQHDQHDPDVSAKGLLGSFLGFEGNKRTGPLASTVVRRDVVDAFGERKGAAIWQALEKMGWITLEDKGQQGAIRRGPQFGSAHFQGPLAPFAGDATRDRLMAILDRRVVMVAYGDNANLSTAVAEAIGTLLQPPLVDQSAAAQLRREMEQFLENQRPGYEFLLGPNTGLLRFGWNASTGRFFGWDEQGHWKIGHSDYLVNEFRGPTMFVLLRYGLPKSTLANLAVKFKSYRLADGRLIYTPAPWEGSAFQALGLSLSMEELGQPSWKRILGNLVDIELDYAARHNLPGFLSEGYSGWDNQYTGAIGIPEITVDPNPRITDAPSLYTLGVAYAIAPDGVERLLGARWDLISQLLTEHGPWEGYNTTQGKVIQFQTSVHVLSIILGALNSASDDMARYLASRGLSEGLAALYNVGNNLDLLSPDTKAIGWTPDKTSVRVTREASGLHFRGEDVGQAGLTFVPPGLAGASLAGGTLVIRCHARQPIEKATIELDKNDPAIREAGILSSEIFLDTSWTRVPGAGEQTMRIPLPATPALSGIREIVLVVRSGEKRGPLDILFTAFQFVR